MIEYIIIGILIFVGGFATGMLVKSLKTDETIEKLSAKEKEWKNKAYIYRDMYLKSKKEYGKLENKYYAERGKSLGNNKEKGQ